MKVKRVFKRKHDDETENVRSEDNEPEVKCIKKSKELFDMPGNGDTLSVESQFLTDLLVEAVNEGEISAQHSNDTASSSCMTSPLIKLEDNTNCDKEDIQVAIIDNSSYNGLIDPTKFMLIEEKLILAISKQQQPKPHAVQFNGSKWYRGYKIINCGTMDSLEFLNNFIKNLGEIWPGCCLEIIPKSNLLLSTTIWVKVPPPYPFNDESMLHLMKVQNPRLNVSCWEILHCDHLKDVRQYVIGIDRVSTADLRRDPKLRYGLNLLKVCFTDRFTNEANKKK